MAQYSHQPRFDASFAALSNPTRRGVLEHLMRADASVTDLAERFHMTLTGMSKHIGILEQAELVTTEKVGRVRTCRLGSRRLEEESAWTRTIAACGPRASTRWTRSSRNSSSRRNVMVARKQNEAARARNRTTSERKSDREMVIMRTFDAPPLLVFEAWTTPELFKQWWVPESSGATLLSCEQDVRVGGGYRLEFAHPKAAATMVFFGRYLEVVPNARLVWTNEESENGAVTTVTFEEKDGKTLLVMSERYPSEEALHIAIEGMDEAMPETFEQLDEFLLARGAGAQQR
jgi:uncharacterized protein YndB with AHSA1/START domain/DNA-binding transcriptional ArsR family regulator